MLLVGYMRCTALSNNFMCICGARLFVGSRTALSSLMLNFLKLNIVNARNGVFPKLLIVDLCYLESSFAYFLLLFVELKLVPGLLDIAYYTFEFILQLDSFV